MIPDLSLFINNRYLHSNPNSIIAVNLKACNHFKLYNGKAAETELKQLTDIGNCRFTFGEDLVKHNLVVFRSGENALQVLPPLLGIFSLLLLFLFEFGLMKQRYHSGGKIKSCDSLFEEWRCE